MTCNAVGVKLRSQTFINRFVFKEETALTGGEYEKWNKAKELNEQTRELMTDMMIISERRLRAAKSNTQSLLLSLLTVLGFVICR